MKYIINIHSIIYEFLNVKWIHFQFRLLINAFNRSSERNSYSSTNLFVALRQGRITYILDGKRKLQTLFVILLSLSIFLYYYVEILVITHQIHSR